MAKRAAAIADEYGCDGCGSARRRRWACSPPGCGSGPAITRAVALTHGHEAGWAALPGARGLLRRIARGVDVVTYLGEYFRVRLGHAIGELTTLERLAPGVDVEAFSPKVSGAGVRVGMAWATGRSSSASPGWCRARARTR